ncbi:hypothetical protein OG320_01485 [Microbispora sp. NBC_01189]|uniref:sigma factor n=1 Tax=Microbispora sp. NBC_01189 TaxID=2903583 RepID=UPI002E0EBAD0|nr:hypothetical protein OG320_01485 [Microbispora sp. NBC_01189]
MDSTFEAAWGQVSAQVAAYCGRVTDDPADAADLIQRVAIRAWRGHASFRGDAAYLTWVMAIARREAARQAARKSRITAREIPLAGIDQAESPAGPGMERSWLPTLIKEARLAGAISEVESRVLTARLSGPEAGWAEIGGLTGMTATAAAVTHCRAVPKLRVFLFRSRSDLIGGHPALAAAFERTRRARGGEALTPAEAEVFEAVVLDERASYRPRGWQTVLRGACGKVAKHLLDW